MTKEKKRVSIRKRFFSSRVAKIVDFGILSPKKSLCIPVFKLLLPEIYQKYHGLNRADFQVFSYWPQVMVSQ